MPHFTLSLNIKAPVEKVFAFHESPDAFARLTPSWADVRIIQPVPGIYAGAEGIFSVPLLGPIRRRWHAVHTVYEKNRLFVDEQKSGPFAYWRHEHRFFPDGEGSRLEDAIEFRLPGGPLLNWLAAPFVRWQLRQLFNYRHVVTKRICEAPSQS